MLGIDTDAIGADSLRIAAIVLLVPFGLWNQILRFIVRTLADAVQEGKAIPHGNTDLRTELTSSSCFATNDGTAMWLNQVDDLIRDAACIGICQNAFLAVQLTDHKKFLPPVRAQAQKACPRGDQSIICIKIPLDYPETSATLRSRSVQGIQQQTALAIRSVIAASEKRLLKRKQYPPR